MSTCIKYNCNESPLVHSSKKYVISQRILSRLVDVPHLSIKHFNGTFNCIDAYGDQSVLAIYLYIRLREFIHEKQNGLFAAGENPIVLAKTIKNFISSKETFKKDVIVKNTSVRFNYCTVGKQFDVWYKSHFEK